MDKKIVQIHIADIEEEMRKYNPSFEKLTIKEITKDPSRYKLLSTTLDDHFTVLVRCASKDAILKAKDYLSKKGFNILGSLDTYGVDKIKENYIKQNAFPMDVINQTISKVCEYLKIDINEKKEIGQNKEDDYYFYFYPINNDCLTWYDFKKSTYLDKLNEFAKEASQSIDLIFSQLDNVVYGGLKLIGKASENLYDAYFEAVNVQVNKSNMRTLYIACKNILQLANNDDELSTLGCFQMFFVDEEIFYEEQIEEIYLDFPNEVDEEYFKNSESSH